MSESKMPAPKNIESSTIPAKILGNFFGYQPHLKPDQDEQGGDFQIERKALRESVVQASKFWTHFAYKHRKSVITDAVSINGMKLLIPKLLDLVKRLFPAFPRGEAGPSWGMDDSYVVTRKDEEDEPKREDVYSPDQIDYTQLGKEVDKTFDELFDCFGPLKLED
ncbi:hypothetical protein Vi05172_g7347 [Venturia inaequalis]|nr:hypothetical protein Vi05172_g7347 [Venturia inaequalis]